MKQDERGSAPTEQAARPSSDAEAAFQRAMVRLTLLFWAGIYLLFTLRAIARAHGHLWVQAGLRVAMMGVGVGLCAALYLAFGRLKDSQPRFRLPATAALTAAATLAYVCTNYVLFYLLVGLWGPDHGAVAIIGSYLTEFCWIFAAWVLLYFYVRHRLCGPAGGQERAPLRSIWVKQRDSEVCVAVESIERIEAEGDYVRILTADRSYLMRATMRSMEDALDPELFVRVHRRVIVPTRLVRAIERRPDSRIQLRLADGALVPVGRHYLSRLKEISA